jgi:hypothetical protein
MTQSNAFKDEIDATIDEGLTHYRDDSPLKRMSLGKDRALMVEDLRMAVELDSAYSGKRVDFREHEKWAKDRAKLRFPDDENAQKSYARMLEGNWIEHRANKKLRNHPKTAHLYEAKDKAEQVFSEAQSRHWDVDKELRAEHRLVQTKGVTPEQNADIVKEVLRDAGRTMTDKPSQSIKGTKKNVAELRDEMTKIPDELWVPTKYTGLSVRAVASGRGHWSSGRQEIKTDGSGSRKASTLLHEATHAVENMNPQVTQLEFVMFERRAKGRQPEKLQKLYKGMGYKKHEEAVVDEWSSAYSGKRYGTSRSSTHEIMTMGIESLFRRGDYPSPLADDDHLNFVMGVLAHA